MAAGAGRRCKWIKIRIYRSQLITISMPIVGSTRATRNYDNINKAYIDGAVLVKVASDPPAGGRKIVNIYVNQDGKLVVVYETE